MTKPPGVQIAVTLLYASLLVGVLKSIADFSRLVAGASLGMVLFTMLFTLSLLAFLIVMISQRKNWARIVFLILFLLGIPISVPIYLQEFGRSAIAGSVSMLQVALQVAALVLLFKSTSGAWFKGKQPGSEGSATTTAS